MFMFLANAQRHKWCNGDVFQWLVENHVWAYFIMAKLVAAAEEEGLKYFNEHGTKKAGRFAASVQRVADYK